MANLFFATENTLRSIEGEAGAAIPAGSVVAFTGERAIGLSAADGDDAALLVADYNQLKAGGDWESGDTMVCRQLPADEVAYVRVAAGQNITNRFTGLAIGTAGTLRIAGAEDAVACFADEVINTGAAVALVRVRGK